MTDTVIVAVLSVIGTLGGSFGGVLAANKLTNYRIEQLEKRVQAHNLGKGAKYTKSRTPVTLVFSLHR